MTTDDAIKILSTERDNVVADITNKTQQLEAINTAIAQLQDLLNTPPDDLKAAQATIADLNDQITQLQKDKAALQTQVTAESIPGPDLTPVE